MEPPKRRGSLSLEGFGFLRENLIGVFELLVTWAMDRWGWTRRQAVLRNGVALALLSIPCVLGFNVWSGFVVPGIGDIQSIEDFIVSNNILPLGSLVFALYCCNKFGWGWDNFLAEANAGKGWKVKAWMKPIFRYLVPAAIIFIYIYGMVTFGWK